MPTDPTETTETTPPEPTPTPASKLEPDDQAAPFGTVQFYCPSCGNRVHPISLQMSPELNQNEYTYSCLTCQASPGTDEALFRLVVPHEQHLG